MNERAQSIKSNSNKKPLTGVFSMIICNFFLCRHTRLHNKNSHVIIFFSQILNNTTRAIKHESIWWLAPKIGVSMSHKHTHAHIYICNICVCSLRSGLNARKQRKNLQQFHSQTNNVKQNKNVMSPCYAFLLDAI